MYTRINNNGCIVSNIHRTLYELYFTILEDKINYNYYYYYMLFTADLGLTFYLQKY